MAEIKLPEVKILPISKLHPHEELDAQVLSKIDTAMKIGIFTNPIIVDKSTNVVLDGMHRLELLKTMNYRYIPCQLVDYLTDAIDVRTWYPTIYCKGSVHKSIKTIINLVQKFCKQKGLIAISSINHSKILEYIEKRECLAGVIFSDVIGRNNLLIRYPTAVAYPYDIDTIIKFLRDFLNTLENKLNTMIFKYHPDDRAKPLLDASDRFVGEDNKKYTACCTIYRPCIQKEEVLEWALEGRLYPKKTTRHIVKTCRALYINIPFSILKSRTISESRVNKLLQNLITDPKHIHRLYAEPVYIYDELMEELRKLAKRK
jgi:hypothetical protein